MDKANCHTQYVLRHGSTCRVAVPSRLLAPGDNRQPSFVLNFVYYTNYHHLRCYRGRWVSRETEKQYSKEPKHNTHQTIPWLPQEPPRRQPLRPRSLSKSPIPRKAATLVLTLRRMIYSVRWERSFIQQDTDSCLKMSWSREQSRSMSPRSWAAGT